MNKSTSPPDTENRSESQSSARIAGNRIEAKSSGTKQQRSSPSPPQPMMTTFTQQKMMLQRQQCLSSDSSTSISLNQRPLSAIGSPRSSSSQIEERSSTRQPQQSLLTNELTAPQSKSSTETSIQTHLQPAANLQPVNPARVEENIPNHHPPTSKQIRDISRQEQVKLELWWSLGVDPMRKSLSRVLAMTESSNTNEA